MSKYTAELRTIIDNGFNIFDFEYTRSPGSIAIVSTLIYSTPVLSTLTPASASPRERLRYSAGSFASSIKCLGLI